MKLENLQTNSVAAYQTESSSYFDYLQDPDDLLKAELKQILHQRPTTENNERIDVIVNKLLNQFEVTLQADNLLSANSVKTIKFNWNKFVNWCTENSLRYLPASVSVFEQFLTELSTSSKANSLQVCIWAVNSVHNATGLPSPTSSPKIKTLLKGIKKNKARKGEVISQVSPFKEVHLTKLIEIWKDTPRLVDIRNLCLLCFAYETLLRESELARVKFEDLSFRDDGRAVLIIPFTKTNHSGLADKVMLSRECVNLLKDMLSRSGMPLTGLIFRPVLKSNNVKWINNPAEYSNQSPLTGYTIDKIFQYALMSLRTNEPFIVHNTERWSGHSARVGACQDLLAKGHSHIAAQQSGRWSSIEMVYRYGRDILAEDGAMIKSRWDK